MRGTNDANRRNKMTSSKIQKKAEREMKKFELAKQIREMLDAARKEYGPTDWDDDDIESQIAEMVFEE